MLPNRPPLRPWRVELQNIIEHGKLALGRGATLEKEAIFDIAAGATRLSDPGDRYFEEGLDQILMSANEAGLTAIARRTLRDNLWSNLARRMMMTAVKKKHPEIFQQRLAPSFLVMGYPRTGTTHLHRLLSLDPDFAGVPLWQLVRPVPIHLFDEGAPDQRREGYIRYRQAYSHLARDKKHVHYNDADSPEECTVLNLSTFHSSIYWSTIPLYRFADWLMREARKNIDKCYQEHREYLLLLQHQRNGKGFSLKAPEHTPALASIRKISPETMIIQTHRNPIDVSNSLNSMVYGNHANTTRHLDVKRMAKTNLEVLDLSFRYNMEAREQYPGQVLDVYFDDITKRPIKLIKRIYAHYGLPWPDGHEHVIQAYLDANPRGKYGKHKYKSEDFGLTDKELRSHFADYIDTFGLEQRFKIPA